MKNLFNVSPFILLLVPFFVMTILVISISSARPAQGTEMAAKTTANQSCTLTNNNILIAK
ncbi:hypothetical protein TH53_11525 [Pedobacter lusitanus]|uniref:Uncharacterized protein n=1 Tax=Pedobacter lusitanus TaxID=1503925 RepID=A0A0D0FX44_9SPHI|nr:hypothetical protein [Pedobacter lusitanus]KIO77089.1 hypothetical protein TH53_11525 [Pedobacter lusitanus]